MMSDYEPPPHREGMLTVVLTGMVLVFALALLVVIAGQWVIWLVMVVAGMAAFAGLHYVLWGKLLDDQVAGEREEAELLRRIEERDS